MNYYSVFRVNDLMYFIILVCGTTLLDVSVDKREDVFRVLSSTALLLMLAVAALFLGISSQNVAEPPATEPYLPQMKRLTTSSLVLSGTSLVLSVLIEIRLCFKRNGSENDGSEPH